MWCWGRGTDYGKDDGRWTDVPLRVDGVTDAARVVLGETHACALTNAGLLWCWGTNEARQIEDPVDSMVSPALVTFSPAPIEAVGLSPTQTCVLDALSHVYCRGNGVSGVRQIEIAAPFDMPGPGTEVVDVSGQVFEVEHGEKARPLPKVEADNRALTASGRPRCLVKRGGGVWCTDYRRQDREEDDEAFRTRLALKDRVVQAGTGELFLCALTTDGAVWCEGVNDMGQLGRGRSSPVEAGGFVPGLQDVRRSSVAQQSACALRADGNVWCWGGFRHLEKGPTPSRVSKCVGQSKPLPALELAATRPAKSSARPGEPL